MSVATLFVCSHCAHELEAWDDGNPYYLDERGEKRHAYHPEHELLARCIGNDDPHLCLSCAAEFMVDTRAPSDRCPSCDATDIVATIEVGACRCPWCKTGRLTARPGFHAIS